MGNVTVTDNAGRAYDVPEEQVPGYVSQGFTVQTPIERVAPATEEARQDRYGGRLSAALAAGTVGALGTATGGLSDVAFAATGGAQGLRDLKDLHPVASGAGSLAGALVPSGFGGLASSAGTGIAERLGGGIIARTAGGAAEGALFGVGQGISELAADQEPLTWERASSAISSNALFGAAVGGGIGLVGSTVERGLSSARNAIEARLTRTAADGGIAAVSPDLLTLDVPALKLAREAEVTQLEAARAPITKNAIEELDAYRNMNRDARGIRDSTIVSEGATRDVSEAGASFVDADFRLRKLLDNRVYLAENPKQALKFLTQQQQALEEIIPWGDAMEKAWRADVEAAPLKIRAQIVAKEVPGEIGPFTPAGLDAAVERTLKERQTLRWGEHAAFKDGLKAPAYVENAADFRAAAERNRQLQNQLKGLVEPVQSPRLTAIDAAREALNAPHTPSLSERLISHLPGGGLVNELRGLGGRAVSGLGRAANAAADQTGKAISAFLGAAEKVAPAVIPTATTVLSSLRFGAGPPAKSDELHDLFTARAAELREQRSHPTDRSRCDPPRARGSRRR